MNYLDIANKAVVVAQKLGCAAAEAYILNAKALTIEVSNQELETMKFAEDSGIGLRIISRDGKIGFAYSTDLNTTDDLVRQAIINSYRSFADKNNALPTVPQRIDCLDLLDPKIAAVTIEDKINLAKQVEISAQKAGVRVTRTERCVYQDTEYGVALANSNGLATYYQSGYCGLYGIVLAEKDGDVQSGSGMKFSRTFDALNAESVGREAADDATVLLGAKSIGTTKASLVLNPQVATGFFSILVPALCADSVQKGRSLFQGKIGKQVVSPLLNLVDDGRLDEGIASAPVDGEGVPTQRTHLIVNGVLNSYLYNSYTAAKDKVNSTGNGRRGSFKSMPEVGPTNIFIQAGKIKRDMLIKEVKDGFYVTSVMGMHTANPISGDFSIGAAGIWIKNGQFTQAIRGVAIAGNILELFGQVDAIADDLRFYGAQGSPTLRISNITISGS